MVDKKEEMEILSEGSLFTLFALQQLLAKKYEPEAIPATMMLKCACAAAGYVAARSGADMADVINLVKFFYAQQLKYQKETTNVH